ncbi:MAG: HD domain-containing protein [Thermoplasmata archaeon]
MVRRNAEWSIAATGGGRERARHRAKGHPKPRVEEMKTVHDPVHGSLDIGGVFLELLESAELQRLHGIRQLGLASLVFPGANHTRLEHSLGCWYIGRRMAQELGVEEGLEELSAACLLHDLGHYPFSHTLETVLHDAAGIDHVRLTREIITGRTDVLRDGEELPGRRRVSEILQERGVDAELVAELVSGEFGSRPEALLEEFAGRGRRGKRAPPGWLGGILHGAIDADQLDYLLRDSHYTGVAYGVIDLPRLLRTIAPWQGGVAVRKSGLAAVESVLVARALMYSSVYFHHTVRIAEMMLARAVERMEDLKELDVPRMVDWELLQHLAASGGFQREIALRLKYRRLFKRAHTVPLEGLDERRVERLAELEKPAERRRLEDELARKAGAPEGYVIVDFPSKELLLSEPRMHRTGIMILDEETGRLRPLSRHSPLARALQLRRVPDWAVMVSTDARFRSDVARAARAALE